MTEQGDRDILTAGVQKAQKRLAEIDHGVVQTIPNTVRLRKKRKIFQRENAEFSI